MRISFEVWINLVRSVMWGFALQEPGSKHFWINGLLTAVLLMTIFSEIHALERKLRDL